MNKMQSLLFLLVACRNEAPSKDTGGLETVVENDAPVAESVVLSPSQARTNDSIAAFVTLSDSDPLQSLSATYDWVVVDTDGNEVLAQSGSESSLDGLQHFDRDDRVYVRVTPFDGEATGNPLLSEIITISNSAPTMPMIGLSPDPATVEDSLLCAVDSTSSDADGDALTYTYVWTDQAGVQHQQTQSTELSDVLDSSLVTPGTWTCAVSATDDRDSGPTATATVEVQDICLIGEQQCPGLSCMHILQLGGSTGDGIYWIDSLGTGAFEVHCDMTTDGGGWTELVGADYSQETCPTGWNRSTTFAQVCTRETASNSALIYSTFVDNLGIPYEELRGRAEIYQYGSNDAFGDFPPISIDDTYMDGLSITHTANGSRVHLFTYAIGFGAISTDDSNCPGVQGGAQPHSFVGGDYFCATANSSSGGPGYQWYTGTPLFSADWFQISTTDSNSPIELRLMATHPSWDEDVGVKKLNLQLR